MRLPKRGFTHEGDDYQVVNLADLNVFDDGTTVTSELLKAHGLVRSLKRPVKLLGNGELTAKNLQVHLDAYSKSAVQALQGAGGSAAGAETQAEGEE